MLYYDVVPLSSFLYVTIASLLLYPIWLLSCWYGLWSQFLPAGQVKEKAKKLKSILSDDILSSTTSQNMLAMTFRQVVLEQLWNWEMVIFKPGMQRNMEDLMKPREVRYTLFFDCNHLPISVLLCNTITKMSVLQVPCSTDRLSSLIPFLSAGPCVFHTKLIRWITCFHPCRSRLPSCSWEHWKTVPR